MFPLSEHRADQLAALGPYFAVDTCAPSGEPRSPWLLLSDSTSRATSLVDHYRQVQTVLATRAGRPVHLRVAASTGHLGLVSRLVCASMGAAALGFRLDLSTVWWRPTLGGPLPMLLPADAIGPPGTDTTWRTLVAALTEATAQLSVSRQVLRGNVDSAVNAAAAAIGATRPDLAASALAAARHLLVDTGPGFRRRSCCLIYQAAPPTVHSLCGDCVRTAPMRAVSAITAR